MLASLISEVEMTAMVVCCSSNTSAQNYVYINVITLEETNWISMTITGTNTQLVD